MNQKSWLVFVVCLLVATSALAVSPQRTFVASSGQDTNPCSLTAPCRGFQAAIDAVAAAGEVIVLDSGGYGAVTITKPVTITAPGGIYAGISVSSGNGVTVNAGGGDKVMLRSLTINNQSSGFATGINVISAGEVQIENCTITGLPTGINASLASQAKLLISGTTIIGSGIISGVAGVSVTATTASGSTSRVEIWRSVITGSPYGIKLSDIGYASIGDSLIADNPGRGVDVSATPLAPATRYTVIDRTQIVGNADGVYVNSSFGGALFVSISHSVLSNHVSRGIYAGGNSWIHLNGNTISGNGTGVYLDLGASPIGAIGSIGNNMRSANVADGVGVASSITPF